MHPSHLPRAGLAAEMSSATAFLAYRCNSDTTGSNGDLAGVIRPDDFGCSGGTKQRAMTVAECSTDRYTVCVHASPELPPVLEEEWDI